MTSMLLKHATWINVDYNQLHLIDVPETTDNESVFSDAADSVVEGSIVSQSTIYSKLNEPQNHDQGTNHCQTCPHLRVVHNLFYRTFTRSNFGSFRLGYISEQLVLSLFLLSTDAPNAILQSAS